MKAFLARYPSRRDDHGDGDHAEQARGTAACASAQPASRCPQPSRHEQLWRSNPVRQRRSIPEPRRPRRPLTSLIRARPGPWSSSPISLARSRAMPRSGAGATPGARRLPVESLRPPRRRWSLLGTPSPRSSGSAVGTPATGTLSVGTSPAGIAVFVDGQPHGVTPLGVELPPGEHVIELRTETERRRIPITLTAGGQVSQYFEFARRAAADRRTAGANRSDRRRGHRGWQLCRPLAGERPRSRPGHAHGRDAERHRHADRARDHRKRRDGVTGRLDGRRTKAAAAGWIRLDVPADVQVLENGRRSGPAISSASCCRSGGTTSSSSTTRSAIASGAPCRSRRDRSRPCGPNGRAARWRSTQFHGPKSSSTGPRRRNADRQHHSADRHARSHLPSSGTRRTSQSVTVTRRASKGRSRSEVEMTRQARTARSHVDSGDHAGSVHPELRAGVACQRPPAVCLRRLQERPDDAEHAAGREPLTAGASVDRAVSDVLSGRDRKHRRGEQGDRGDGLARSAVSAEHGRSAAAAAHGLQRCAQAAAPRAHSGTLRHRQGRIRSRRQEDCRRRIHAGSDRAL